MTSVTTAPAPADDRVGNRSVLSTILARPEVGALIGAIAVALDHVTVEAEAIPFSA